MKKLAAIATQNQLYAAAAHIGELKKTAGAEAAKVSKALVKYERRDVRRVETK